MKHLLFLFVLFLSFSSFANCKHSIKILTALNSIEVSSKELSRISSGKYPELSSVTNDLKLQANTFKSLVQNDEAVPCEQLIPDFKNLEKQFGDYIKIYNNTKLNNSDVNTTIDIHTFNQLLFLDFFDLETIFKLIKN